ncbi:hypothetical protein [Sphingomonas sp. dw_22]|uniref:hypothetical protein n=1 Tax=Sphingomonas sp. dw_22 TaxID=2721175 RepID=UPI001BD337CF|nr:hypothetical protein [Sphingomonas sp. dw_22]
MTEAIINEAAIDAGEPYFIVYVDRPKGVGQSVVATLETGLIGPVTPEKMTPRWLTGFELPASQMVAGQSNKDGAKRCLISRG